MGRGGAANPRQGILELQLRLSPEQKAKVSAELKELNQCRIPFEEVQAREEHLMDRYAQSVLHRLILRFHPRQREVREAVRAKYDSFEAEMAKAAGEIRG